MYVDQSLIQSLFKPQFVAGVFQKAIEQSFVLKNATRLPNMTGKTMDMDILSNLPMAYWKNADIEHAKLTTLGLTGKRIYAETVEVILPIAIDSINDAQGDLKKLITDRLAEALASTIDTAVIQGKNKPANFREGIIPSCINANAKVTLGNNLYNALNDAMGLVEESDYEVSAFVGGLNTKKMFRSMLDQSGQPIAGTEIDAMPKLFVKNGAWDKTLASLLVGDLKQVYYSMRQELEVTVLTEATLKDPTHVDSNGNPIEYNLAQQDMIALKVKARMGWEIPNPVSIETQGKTHFPFAIVVPSDGTDINTLTATLTITNGITPIKNANVYVGGQEFITDSTGVVTAKIQKNQTYNVSIFADGYYSFTKKITSAETAVTETITLKEYPRYVGIDSTDATEVTVPETLVQTSTTKDVE